MLSNTSLKSQNYQLCTSRIYPGPIVIQMILLFVNTTSLLELIVFADDKSLLFSHPDIASQNEIIDNELQEICNWFQANNLSVNASKTITWCSELIIASTRNFIDINQDIDTLNDSESTSSKDVEKVKLKILSLMVCLYTVSSTKFLCVIIDENYGKSH